MPDTALMVDLETMGTKNSSVIVAIGACTFNPRGDSIEDTFSVNISIKSNMDAGRTVDPDTLTWWFTQSKAAQDAFLTNPTNLRDALLQFQAFVQKNQPSKFFANDPDFDLVILSDAYDCLQLNRPWGFWQSRSMRTLKDLGTADGSQLPDFSGEGIAHAALDDAVKQAMQVQYVYHKLGA